MTRAPDQAGYIVTDATGIIYGIGSTKAEAWEDFERTVSEAGVTVVTEIDEDQSGTVLAEDFEVLSSTAALLDQVRRIGGNVTWEKLAGVCCTVEEYNEFAP